MRGSSVACLLAAAAILCYAQARLHRHHHHARHQRQSGSDPLQDSPLQVAEIDGHSPTNLHHTACNIPLREYITLVPVPGTTDRFILKRILVEADTNKRATDECARALQDQFDREDNAAPQFSPKAQPPEYAPPDNYLRTYPRPEPYAYPYEPLNGQYTCRDASQPINFSPQYRPGECRICCPYRPPTTTTTTRPPRPPPPPPPTTQNPCNYYRYCCNVQTPPPPPVPEAPTRRRCITKEERERKNREQMRLEEEQRRTLGPPMSTTGSSSKPISTLPSCRRHAHCHRCTVPNFFRLCHFNDKSFRAPGRCLNPHQKDPTRLLPLLGLPLEQRLFYALAKDPFVS